MPIGYNISYKQRKRLVEALLQFDCMKTAQSRAKVVDDLPAEVKNRIKEGSTNWESVDNIVLKCEEKTDWIKELLDRVRDDDPESYAAQRLTEVELEVLTTDPLPVDLLDELRAALSGYEEPCEDWLNLYSGLSIGQIASTDPRTPYEAVLRLLEIQRMRPSALIFVELFAEKINAAWEARKWMSRAARALGVPSKQLETLRQQVTVALTPLTHLLVQLSPVGKRFQLEAWLLEREREVTKKWVDDQPQPIGKIALRLRDIIREAKPAPNNFIVELIVPSQLFCLDMTEWEVFIGREPGSILAHYPVVLRWLNRL